MASSSDSRKQMPSEESKASAPDHHSLSGLQLQEHHRKQERQEGHDREREETEVAFPLMRQSSIYALTLDEIQNAVCEPGKKFGSMNMDEFLANIWSVEEGQASSNQLVPLSAVPTTANVTSGGGSGGGGGASGGGLHGQGSITLPAPLCRKTVDEVWSEIHREQQQRPPSHQIKQQSSAQNASRQPTLGEMTLEDFLVKAGVVREDYSTCSAPQAGQYALAAFQMGQGTSEGVPAGYSHVIGLGYGDNHHGNGGGVYLGEGSGYPAVSYGGVVGGGGGVMPMGNGYGVGLGSPASTGSEDGMGAGQVDNSGVFGGGMEVGGVGRGGGGGRKRAADGAVEKVVERRQRRMIKNRESAARSRARKQAYTVELEGELNHLKEENARLREEERRMQALRRQMLLECMEERARTNAERNSMTLRRSRSCSW